VTYVRLPKFLHISFGLQTIHKIKKLEPIFAEADDWIRYLPNCWIIWTTGDSTYWYNRLAPYLAAEDRLFICEINLTNRQGWLDQWIWEWMDKSRPNVLPVSQGQL